MHLTAETEVTDLENTQCADDHREEWEVENQQGDEEDEEVNGEVGDDEEEDERVDMVGGDQGTEPLHASSWCPVDEVLLDLQQGVQGELQQLVEANEEVRSEHHWGPKVLL